MEMAEGFTIGHKTEYYYRKNALRDAQRKDVRECHFVSVDVRAQRDTVRDEDLNSS
jgi:hypothetical protein